MLIIKNALFPLKYDVFTVDYDTSRMKYCQFTTKNDDFIIEKGIFYKFSLSFIMTTIGSLSAETSPSPSTYTFSSVS